MASKTNPLRAEVAALLKASFFLQAEDKKMWAERINTLDAVGLQGLKAIFTAQQKVLKTQLESSLSTDPKGTLFKNLRILKKKKTNQILESIDEEKDRTSEEALLSKLENS